MPTAARTAYLAWSPGFGRALALSAVAELLLVVSCAALPPVRAVAEDVLAAVQLALLSGAHAMQWWSAIAMLASACCVIQLLLSALALGCSGLNSVLGPLRPPLLVMTLGLRFFVWFVVLTQKPERPQLTTATLSTALSLTVMVRS